MIEGNRLRRSSSARAARAAWGLLGAGLVLAAAVLWGVHRRYDDPTAWLLVSDRLVAAPFIRGLYGDEGPPALATVTAVGRRPVRDRAEMRDALRVIEQQGDARATLSWTVDERAERTRSLPWPPDLGGRPRILSEVHVVFVVALALLALGAWLALRGDPPELRALSGAAAWLAAATLLTGVDCFVGAALSFGRAPHPVWLFFALLPAVILHLALSFVQEGALIARNPAAARVPYVGSALLIAAAAFVGDDGGAAAPIVAVRSIAYYLAFAALALFLSIYGAFTRSRRRADIAGRRLRMRNAKLGAANEDLALAMHNLEVALAEIEERRQRESAVFIEEAAQGRVVANLAHAFQEPLVPLYTFLGAIQADLARHSDLEERYGAAIPKMARRIEELVRLCRSVLVMPRSDAAEDLAEIAGEAADIVRRQVGHEGRKVQLETRTTARPRVRAPHADLFFLVHELTTNAVRAAGESGRVWIRVGERKIEGGGRAALLEVSDTGPGMTPAQIEGLFRLYASDRTEGLHGVGLYIVDKLVRRLAGGIAVTSAPGKGTLIAVEFPAVEHE